MSGATIARVRFTRRWNNYMRGDIAVFPLDTAQNLVAQRVAEGLPPPVQPPLPDGAAALSQPPQRQPGTMVRK